MLAIGAVWCNRLIMQYSWIVRIMSGYDWLYTTVFKCKCAGTTPIYSSLHTPNVVWKVPQQYGFPANTKRCKNGITTVQCCGNVITMFLVCWVTCLQAQYYILHCWERGFSVYYNLIFTWGGSLHLYWYTGMFMVYRWVWQTLGR